MKENDLRLFFSKTSNKFSEIGQIFERELIAVTEHGDALKCEISPTAAQMFDHEAGLFSGKLEIIVNFAKFEVLEDPQPSLFSTEAEYTEVKTEEQIQQEIIEENEAEQEREKEIEKLEKLGLDTNLEKEAFDFTTSKIEAGHEENYHKAKLPDPVKLGGSAFIEGASLKSGFILAYTGEPDNPMRTSIIPLTVNHEEELYPIVFSNSRTADFVLTALNKHPKMQNKIKNFKICDALETDLSSIFVLIVTDGLKFLRALTA